MTPDAPAPRRPSARLIGALFALLFGVLAFGYFLFVRVDYVPVFAQIRPSEASAIVAELENKGIGYRLADGGTTILVPSNQADATRLAIAGSDVAMKGGVGFELFSKSDMGLTDFAQRINYQRALQGELERSLMMLTEVESARVHLALPERTIFRSERSAAKAAVEIVAKAGQSLDAARVAGVQQLVAFAVPDLAPADVVVLDGNGRVLSAATEEPVLSPDAEERRSVRGYYRARARAAVQQALPAMRSDVNVLVLGDGGWRGAVDGGTADMVGPDAAPSSVRNFRLRVTVTTSAPLNAADVALARDAVAAAVALDEAAGDQLSFQVGVTSPATSPPVAAAAPTRDLPLPSAATTAAAPGGGPNGWIAGGILAAVAAMLALLSRRRAPRLTMAEREAMIERVRATLGTDAATAA